MKPPGGLALLIVIGAVLLLPLVGRAQLPGSNLRQSRIPANGQRVWLSEKPILPRSLVVLPNSDGTLPPVTVEVDSALRYVRAYSPVSDSVTIRYRVWLDPLERTFHAGALDGTFSPDSLLDPLGSTPGRVETPRQPPVKIEGVASRGIGPEANGGMLNLRIEGKLSERLSFESKIRDDGLPFQAAGTSADLASLNEVWVRVQDSLWGAMAGHQNVVMGDGFLRANERMMGLSVQAHGDSLGRVLDSVGAGASFGAMQGDRQRQALVPQEGVQGPYYLGGERGYAQNVVLPGSERVYLDGRLLVRGERADYRIDYNQAALHFNPTVPITRFSRIVVEYTTTTSNRTRLLTSLSAGARLDRDWQVALQALSAHDPISPDEGGPGAYTAVMPGSLVSEPEWPATLLPAYVVVDTLVEGITHRIYSYREDNSSKLDVAFTHVGWGRGDYTLSQNSYNRAVYRWIPPRDGAPQGNYAPGVITQAPQSHQVVKLTVGREIREVAGVVRADVAFSHLQSNRFLRGSARNGAAASLSGSGRLYEGGTHTLTLDAEAEWVGRDFSPFNDFRGVEFYSNWAMSDTALLHDAWRGGLRLTHASASGGATLRAQTLGMGRRWGLRIDQSASYRVEQWNLQGQSNLLAQWDAATSLQGAARARITRQIGTVETGATGGYEVRRLPSTKDVPGSSYSTYEALALVEVGYPLFRFALSSGYRAESDSLASRGPSNQLWVSSATASLNTPEGYGLSGQLTHRYHLVASPTATPNSLLASLASVLPIWESRIRLSVESRLSTESLQSQVLHYLPCATGQGTHTWSDMNGDGQPQLEEFLPAQYPEQANYVLQYVRGGSPQRATSGYLAATLNLSPRGQAGPIGAETRWWHRWDVSLNGSHQGKRTDARWWATLVPDPKAALEQPESATSGFAEVALNRGAYPLECGYLFTYTESASRLEQGQQRSRSLVHQVSAQTKLRVPVRVGVSARWVRDWALVPYASVSEQQAEGWALSVQVQYLMPKGTQHTLRAGYDRVRGDAQAWLQEYRYGLEQPIAGQCALSVGLSYAHLRREGAENAMLYRLLRGFSAGHNVAFMPSFRCRLWRTVEAEVSYTLRSYGDNPLVHAGGLRVRAVF